MNNTLFRLNLLYNYCDKNEVFEMLWTHKSLRFILMSTRSMFICPFLCCVLVKTIEYKCFDAIQIQMVCHSCL